MMFLLCIFLSPSKVKRSHNNILLRALKGLKATNSSHFGTANFPANIASENSKTSV
jgi:hypothetical protein